MAAAVMPGILAAWPSVAGRRSSRRWTTSVDSPGRPRKANRSGMCCPSARAGTGDFGLLAPQVALVLHLGLEGAELLAGRSLPVAMGTPAAASRAAKCQGVAAPDVPAPARQIRGRSYGWPAPGGCPPAARAAPETPPSGVVHEPDLAPERREPQIGVVGPQVQAVLRARGEQAVRLEASPRHQVVDHHPEVALRPGNRPRAGLRAASAGVEPRQQPLASRLLVPGGAVDLPGQEQPGKPPAFPASGAARSAG